MTQIIDTWTLEKLFTKFLKFTVPFNDRSSFLAVGDFKLESHSPHGSIYRRDSKFFVKVRGQPSDKLRGLEFSFHTGKGRALCMPSAYIIGSGETNNGHNIQLASIIGDDIVKYTILAGK